MATRETGLRGGIERLRRWSYALDEAYRIPGTRISFGWDPIIGLIPWVGEALTATLRSKLSRQPFSDL
jgi:hypothetical protein